MSKISCAMIALGVVAGVGAAALPLASYADTVETVSGQVTVRASINSSLAISTEGVDLVDFGEISQSSGDHIQSLDVTVLKKGSFSGYNLGVMDYDNDTYMNLDGAIQSGDTKRIPTLESPSNTLKGWGFRVTNRHQNPTQWTGMPEYNVGGTTNIVDNGKFELDEAPVDSVTTNIQFGINIDDLGWTLDDGVYEDVVIFTATATTE